MTLCLKSFNSLLTLINPWFTMRFNKPRSWRLDQPILVRIQSPILHKEYNCNFSLILYFHFITCNGRVYLHTCYNNKTTKSLSLTFQYLIWILWLIIHDLFAQKQATAWSTCQLRIDKQLRPLGYNLISSIKHQRTIYIQM